MNASEVQSLVLRPPPGDAVAHLILTVPETQAMAARELLAGQGPVNFGPSPAEGRRFSLGFSFAGLQALAMPDGYLRIFRSLAPAFAEGAVRRSPRLGDSGDSAAWRWPLPDYRQDRAHVLLSWHGQHETVKQHAERFAQTWSSALKVPLATPQVGRRLGAPKDQSGEWVHFGYRDGLSEVRIDDEAPPPTAPDPRRHAPGALLLGEIDDQGVNPFALPRAPQKVRAFFRHSSFGVLRPMAQDLTAFDQAVRRWEEHLKVSIGSQVSADFVKAKLGGRWPDGRPLRPGEFEPTAGPEDLTLALAADALGQGCPFGSHVRRMQPRAESTGRRFERPLQRRSLPYGLPAWDGAPADPDAERGLLGHFFCAHLEDQFEHLLGQWAARPPPGQAPGDRAQDPLIGGHEDPAAALAVPVQDHPTQWLTGFGAFTTTEGTMYAWYPGKTALETLFNDEFEPDEAQGPWL